LFSCTKTPKACLSLNSKNPMIGEEVEIDAGCSTDARWYDFFLNDSLFDSGNEFSRVKMIKGGTHTIRVKAYSDVNGEPNSFGFCSGCGGKGKTAEASAEVTVQGYTVEITS